MVIEEGGGARTINLCQRCYNEKLAQQGKQSLKSKEWREVVERKAHRGRLWKIFGSEHFLRNVGVFHSQKSMGKKDISGWRSGKTTRNTRQVATRISLQRSVGAGQKDMRTQVAMPK